MRRLSILIATAPLAASLAFAPAARAQTLPRVGTIDNATLAHHAAAPALDPGAIAPCRVVALDDASTALDPVTDNDAAHYARGSVLVMLVFVDHAGGTWTVDERNEQAAKVRDSEAFYRQYLPAAGFLTFDHENSASYYYYQPELDYDLNDYADFENWMVTDAAEAIGFTNDDGDGSVIDEMTFWLQGQLGGWNNVIAIFIPADYSFETAEAGWTTSWCKVSPDMSWGTMAHEWGHVFGACDEGGGPAGCNGLSCNDVCMSYYLVDQVPNGNCTSCPGDVPCIMQGYVNVPPCAYTYRNWAWVDADGSGLLDNTIGWDVDAQNTYTIWEMFHNGWLINTNTDWGFVANQRWHSWSAVGVRSRGSSDYAMSVYGDNNRSHHLASDFFSNGIHFVVGDFNHNNLGENHIRLYNLGGAGQYVLSYEAGDQVLYPDGVDRSQSWASTNVVKAFDVPLFAGETIAVQMDIDTPGLDMGMALFRSNGGTYYAPRTSAVWEADDWPAGISEAYTYDVPADDVYGLVVWSNNELAGNFSIKIGPSVQQLAEATPFTSSLDLRLFSFQPNAFSWAVAAARPGASSNLRLSLFDDAAFTDILGTSGAYPNVEFIAADYNPGHTTNDYLRVVRQSGVTAYRTEWEQGDDILGGFYDGDWQANHVAKVWDAHLIGGQAYRVQMYESFLSLLDTGIYLMSSADGDRYVQRSGAAAGSNGLSNLGEWFTYTPTQTDWYGIVAIANDDNAGTYTVGVGPYTVLPQQVPRVFPDEVVWADVGVGSGSWSAVAVRPEVGSTSLIALWDCEDRFLDCFVTSDYSGDHVRTIAIDGHHAVAQTYYARAERTSGLGSQALSFDTASATDIVFDPQHLVQRQAGFVADEVVQAWDLRVVAAPATLRISVAPQDAGVDLGLSVFDSQSGAYFQASTAAIASADGAGPGGSEHVVFDVATNDVYGLVITNRNGAAGDYTIYVEADEGTSTPEATPVSLALLPSSPNPFNPRTTVRYTLPAAATVDLAIYDLQGRRLRQLLAGGIQASGTHAVVFDGTDDAGATLGAGVYLCRLAADGKVFNQKLTLVK